MKSFQRQCLTFKFLVLIMVLLFDITIGLAQNPTFTWAKRFGGTNDDEGKTIAADGSGNLFIAGFFNSTATFGNTSVISSGARDAFVAKFDRFGNFNWIRQITGNGDDEAYGLGTDQNGNVFVGGNFPSSNAGFGSTNLATRGGDDIFLAKYDGVGDFLWVRQAGGTSHDSVVNVSMDSAGNSYLAGYFRATSTFGNSNLTINGSTSLSDWYFAKYDNDGNFQWVRGHGGSGNDVAYQTVNYNLGNSFVTGYFNSIVDFGGTNLTSSGGSDIFIAKYNSLGNLHWAKQVGGAGSDKGTALALDANGNAFVCGSFQNTVSFGSSNLISRGSADVFLAKYDVSGNLLWVRQGGGTGQDEAWSLVLDDDANCYVTGDVHGTVMFDSVTITNINSTNLFVAKYTSSGILQWAKISTGTNGSSARRIVRDDLGSLFLTGWFSGDANFDGTKISSAGLHDIFMARIDELPSLNFSYGGNQVILSWPTNFIGFVLQTTTNLNLPVSWSDETSAPAISSGGFFVTNDLSSQSRFYRLRKP